MSLTWMNTAGTASDGKSKSAASTMQSAAQAAQNAAAAASSAAKSASDAAQAAAVSLGKGVKQGVYDARSWAAPRIDGAADYCTTTAAPKLADVLHSTARQVEPEAASTKRSGLLTWSLLGAAGLAATGALVALARYRFRAAQPADDMTADQAAAAAPDLAAGKEGTQPGGDKPGTQDTDSSVNGRVTATQW